MIRTFLILFLFSLSTWAQSPLSPVKLDSPRDTMRSFMEAMDDYARGVTNKDNKLKLRINDAIRTLSLENLPYLVRKEEGLRTAKLLKEVIDRVIVINYDLIPDDPSVDRWRLKDTEIIISKIGSGTYKDEFLFSKDTLSRTLEFYNKVKDLPYLKGTTGGAFYKDPWNVRYLPAWAKGRFLGLQNWQWIGLFLAILIGFVIKTLTEFLVSIVKKIITRSEDSTRYKVMLALEKPIGLIAAAGFWFITIKILEFEGLVLAILLVIVQVIFSIAAIWAAYRLSDVLAERFERMAKKTDSSLDDQLVPLIKKSLRVFVIVVGVLVTIQNLGFNVMSIMAGLGLGGLAFALAAKDTAANLFGSIMILTDRPFTVGDWIVADNNEGTVMEVGFRSTRIKTFYDSIITIPNSKMANAYVDNMGLRTYRRIKATLGVTYDTPPDKINAFIKGIKEIIDNNEFTRKDYYHVVFNSYGNFSLNILLYCFLQTPDWATELREKENIYMEILKLAEKLEVSFAFPTQSLHLESLPSQFKPIPLTDPERPSL